MSARSLPSIVTVTPTAMTPSTETMPSGQLAAKDAGGHALRKTSGKLAFLG
jgi:hypothetical protein